MRILGIESSCDETAVAIYDEQDGLLGHVIYSQAKMHAEYGGIVPELASRDHIRKIATLVDQVFEQAGINRQAIDAVAYTAGPGLAGALLVGAGFGRSLAWALNIPAVAIHHMEAHLLVPLMENPALTFPFLSLLVSGGHTLLVGVKGLGRYELIGTSIDDAAGEAFDKTAKLLGLGYPGGPVLAKAAEKGDPARYHFPRPMTDRPGCDFSFSGLKTFALNTWVKSNQDNQARADVARAFEEAVVDTLMIKCRRAIKQTGYRKLVVAGGVGANQRLRDKLAGYADTEQVDVYFPSPEFCTDNGAMVAYAGYLRCRAGEQPLNNRFFVTPRWPVESLKPPST